MIVAAIPSPTTSVWHLLGIPIRAYAICIVLGIVAAVLIMERRLRNRGVAPWASLDIAVWAVPFGIIGARIYHLITSPQDYFGAGGDPIRAFYIWQGGLGIWGAVAGGALGAYLGARQLGLPFAVLADSLAPGLPAAQAIGRFGNWFNNELYGGVTTLPWGLRVHDMDQNNPGHATMLDGKPVTLPDLYQPTFLYEAIWDIGTAVLVWQLDKRYKFGKGRAFALYGMAYTAGRFWIEMLRTDEANHFFGIRLNVFTAAVVFLAALAYFVIAKGPRAYVVPEDAPTEPIEPSEVSADSVSSSDVSAVDVTNKGTQTTAAPRSYRQVSEAQFEEYRRTGVLPSEESIEPAEVDRTALVSVAAPAAAAATAAAATAAPAPSVYSAEGEKTAVVSALSDGGETTTVIPSRPAESDTTTVIGSVAPSADETTVVGSAGGDTTTVISSASSADEKTAVIGSEGDEKTAVIGSAGEEKTTVIPPASTGAAAADDEKTAVVKSPDPDASTSGEH